MTVILIALEFLVPLLFVLVPCMYLFVKQRRWSRSISKANARPPGWLGTVETAVLSLFAAILTLHIASGGIGMATTPLPDAVMQARVLICGIIVAIAIVWMALAKRRSVSFATGGMIVSTLIGTTVLMKTQALSYEHFEGEIRKIPVPVEITLSEQITDVDVLINGVRMGTAPLITTIEEIDAKAPAIDVTEKDFQAGWKNFHGATYLPMQKVNLDRAMDVTTGHHDRQTMNLYVQLERKGQPVMVSGNMGFSGPSRMFGQIQPARLPFSVMTEEWDRNVTLLIERARLADYRVDANWFEAADTYFFLLRNALIAAIPQERQFQQVLTDWARHRYHLDQVVDSASAWRVFETIRNQANEARFYYTDSIAGDAVELLLDQLDANQVIAFARERLSQLDARGPLGFSYGWQLRDGKTQISTGGQSDFTNILPADYVLAQAVWRLDQKWDAEGVSHDNPIEKRLVPSLLRLSYRNPLSRWFANELGGSTIDEFDRRQQRDARSFEPSEDYSQNEYIEGQFVLRAFWQNVNAVGPLGAEFRSVRSQAALELANKLLVKSHADTSLPKWMDFLFMDVKGREPLARDFLKSFQARLAANTFMLDWTLKLNWSYLARMRPLPKAHEFIALFPTQAKTSLEFGNPDQVLSQVPADLRLEIAQGCLDLAVQSKAIADPKSQVWQAMNQIEFELNRLIPTIPSEASAELTMQQLDPANPKARESSGFLKQQGTYGLLTSQMLARLATSSNPECRLWVIPQIRILPNTANRQALERLVVDEDQAVRESATKVAAELEQLRQMPLPKLK